MELTMLINKEVKSKEESHLKQISEFFAKVRSAVDESEKKLKGKVKAQLVKTSDDFIKKIGNFEGMEKFKTWETFTLETLIQL